MSETSEVRLRTVQVSAQTRRMAIFITILAALAGIALGILVLVSDHFPNESYLAWASIALGVGLFVREVIDL